MQLEAVKHWKNCRHVDVDDALIGRFIAGDETFPISRKVLNLKVKAEKLSKGLGYTVDEPALMAGFLNGKAT